MRAMKKGWFWLGALGVLAGCLKVKEFPPEPIITSVSLAQQDSVYQAIIGFTDGDGDIGLAQGDTFPPFEFGGEFYFNLVANYFVADSTLNWKPRGSFGYRIVPLTPRGKIKVLEGELTVNPIFVLSDTSRHFAKISFQLIDKSLKKSNVFESAPFVVGN